MKGFNTGDGYMGLVDGKYILFASESDYYEYMNDQRRCCKERDNHNSNMVYWTYHLIKGDGSDAKRK